MGLLKKIGSAFRGGLSQLINLVKEGANRVFGIFDFFGTLLGITPPKKLRLRVVILRDESGSYLAGASDVQPAIDRATVIFKAQLNTDIVAAGGEMIDTYDPIPPVSALEPECGDHGLKLWLADFKEAGDFYSLNVATNAAAAVTGYATPITAFIVRDVPGEVGCSAGVLTNYVVLGIDGLPTVSSNLDDDVSVQVGQLWLAHELGHACGLWHVGDASNLMHADSDTGVQLGRLQQAVARNSRHITFL